MALVKRQSNTTRMMIILAVVVVVGVVGYVLAKQYFSSTAGNANANTVSTGRTVTTNFGEQILNDSRYTGLQTFGTNLNVDVNSQSGQPQPFQ